MELQHFPVDVQAISVQVNTDLDNSEISLKEDDQVHLFYEFWKQMPPAGAMTLNEFYIKIAAFEGVLRHENPVI